MCHRPQTGENGLFGQGEEAQKIVRAVKAAQADGINAVGLLPADTLFFLAGRGDYDPPLAMYHDQGHGPVKAPGIEAPGRHRVRHRREEHRRFPVHGGGAAPGDGFDHPPSVAV